ncbi:MAG: hypothetical protein U0892_21065 [Pirellulales bacterium]
MIMGVDSDEVYLVEGKEELGREILAHSDAESGGTKTAPKMKNQMLI